MYNHVCVQVNIFCTVCANTHTCVFMYKMCTFLFVQYLAYVPEHVKLHLWRHHRFGSEYVLQIVRTKHKMIC